MLDVNGLEKAFDTAHILLNSNQKAKQKLGFNLPRSDQKMLISALLAPLPPRTLLTARPQPHPTHTGTLPDLSQGVIIVVVALRLVYCAMGGDVNAATLYLFVASCMRH